MTKNYLLKLFATGAVIFSSVTLSAQDKCASDAIHNAEMANNPAYRQKMDDFENYLSANKAKISSVQGGGLIYRIPVVVHVMHKGEALGTGTNVSDAAIKDGIKFLNERFRKVAGTPGDANGVDVEMEFALAVRDGSGNCTDGITRTDMSSDATYMQYGIKRSGLNGITDAALKAVISWNQTQYYNIWLISEIDDNGGGSGTQGYAYYASAHGTSVDGAVMLAGKFILQDRVTLTHELGHAFNLYHTFEGDGTGSTCPVGNGCGSGAGDCCADTPPHKRTAVGTCTDVANTCDGGSSSDLYLHNYLDYSSDVCQNEFTADQKTRMRAALTTTRSSFLSTNGNISLVPVTTAGIDFSANSSFVCSGSTIDFIDRSTCSPNTYINTAWAGTTFNWSCSNNAGTTYTSTNQNPSITFANPGTYDVTLSVTNVNGTNSYTQQGMVIVSAAPVTPTCTGVSTYTLTNTYGIFEVKLNTLDHLSSGTYGDMQSGVTNASGYGDFACTAGTVLEANTTYTISIKGTSNASLMEDFKVYIDYNNDGDFVDVGEEIAFFDEITGSAALMSATFTTPASATLNTGLRMRVFSARNTETITPCFTTSRGQIHDYGIWITDRTARVSITPSPSGTINAGTNVTFTAAPINGGAGPTYKWYKNNVIIGGATSVTYASTTLADNDEIYCVMTSNLANVIASPCTSNVVIMDVNCISPNITTDVSSSTICSGATTTYSIVATNATSYLWEVSTNGGGAWSTVNNGGVYTGATTATLTITGATTGMTSYQYRVSAIGGCGPNDMSSAGILTVNALPAAPTTSAVTYCQNATASSLTATGTSLLWYTGPTGGTGSSTAPTPSTASTGTTPYYVSQTTSGCEGPRATLNVIVNATPATPTINVVGLNLTSSSATGNQWYFNGSPIGGATSQNYTATQNGNYTVVVTQSGCPSASSAISTVSSVGLNSNSSFVSTNLFPNPNKGEFTITINSTEKTNFVIEITNVLGEVIYKEQLRDQSGQLNKQIDISKYGAGLYFVTLKNSKHSSCKKIVVQ